MMGPKAFWNALHRTPMVSPRGFLVRAVALAVVFAICHAAGLREHTAVLSGTIEAQPLQVTLGVVYVCAYLGFVLAAPALVIAAIVFAALTALRRRGLGRTEGHAGEGPGKGETA